MLDEMRARMKRRQSAMAGITEEDAAPAAPRSSSVPATSAERSRLRRSVSADQSTSYPRRHREPPRSQVRPPPPPPRPAPIQEDSDSDDFDAEPVRSGSVPPPPLPQKPPTPSARPAIPPAPIPGDRRDSLFTSNVVNKMLAPRAESDDGSGSDEWSADS